MNKDEVFTYWRRVNFYETDLMRIVHHSNYLRFCEEARVDWALKKGLIEYQQPNSAYQLAVLETRVQHVKPAVFGDQLKICVQARLEKIRIIFQYRIYKVIDTVLENTSDRLESKNILKTKLANNTEAAVTAESVLLARIETKHVALDLNLKPIKPPQEMQNIFRKELPWIETWL